MTVDFVHQRQHLDRPRQAAPGGRLVLSQLSGGSSQIARAAVCVKVVLEGEERYEASGRTHRLGAGSLMIADVGSAMQVSLPAGGEATGLCVYMPANPSDQPWESALSGSPLVMPLVDHPFGAALTALAQTLARRPEHGEEAASGALEATRRGLNHFVQDLGLRIGALSGGKAATRLELLRRIETARAYLHAVRDRAVPLDELARIAAVSPFHLARAFREAHGAAPAAYHRNLRMAWAADMLASGQARPAQVARQLGFADQASFTRAFVRRYGAPPGAARQTGAPT
ncbi:helix-turn-helix domain-containing protein [Caulobacter sp. NIBR2454]|uniref:helix-turn-helix domain-containing protein n=1 Tax=Caulobacter sp. NIBR2454 TaxID=3015996 RepID=UPI0022B62641|nr:AraC family transcriptional regulator [Caulobacter sp. NIBR2454]